LRHKKSFEKVVEGLKCANNSCRQTSIQMKDQKVLQPKSVVFRNDRSLLVLQPNSKELFRFLYSFVQPKLTLEDLGKVKIRWWGNLWGWSTPGFKPETLSDEKPNWCKKVLPRNSYFHWNKSFLISPCNNSRIARHWKPSWNYFYKTNLSIPICLLYAELV
jgi:hypothetical protein